MEIAARVAAPGWHIVIHFETVDLPDLWHFFSAVHNNVGAAIEVDQMGRPDVSQPVEGPKLERFLRFMQDHARVYTKRSCPERLSVHGPRALPGDYTVNAYVVPYPSAMPFARRIVQIFSNLVLWGTDWPHPNLLDHMPNGGLLVDFISHIAPTPGLQQRLVVDNPMRLCGPTEV